MKIPMRTFTSRRWLTQCAIAASAILSMPVASAAAQAADSSRLPRVSLFTKDDAYLGAFFIAGTLALRPFDKRVAGELQQPESQANRLFQNLSTDVRVIAVPGAVIIGTSMYAVGRLAHGNRLADLGLHGLEALAVGDVVNTAIKWSVGRARPYVVRDTNPSDYGFLRGLKKGRDYSSFPSGHVLAAFAAAAAVSNEASRWWPGSQWYVGTAMYGGATAVALSRLYNNQHWASDVIMAAGIGTFAGNKVVRFNHRTSPHNRVDRWLLSASLEPAVGGGVALTWTVLPR
jgi:membrane-associated phospholipid phosphatase